MRIRTLAAVVFVTSSILSPFIVEADPADCAGTSAVDGIAVDHAGRGIPNVGVHVEPADHVNGFSAMTGSDGRFHIACVRPGDAYIEAGTETLATTPLVITIPQSKHAFVRFEMVATIIAGIVTTADGAPAGHAKVSVHGPIDGSNNEGQDVEVDAHGHFEMRALPPGRYNLEVHRDNLMAQRVVTTSDDNLKIVVAPAAPPRAR
jgi:hypothetical protein